MEPSVAIEREVVIRNKEGLHFRPIMKLVDLASKYSARIQLQCEGRTADARSPMELLMLVATPGSKLKLIADGADAEQAVEAIRELIESGFHEI